MMETGVPIVEALEALEQHAEDKMIRQALAQAHSDLSQGKTIAQAMAAQPHVFPAVYVSMIRTAETGGSLDEMLDQAAEYLEASLEMRRKVTGALTYPAVLMIVALGVLIFMMTYLLPRFGPLFEHMGAEIPTSTRLLLAASAFLQKQWWTIPLTLGGGAWGFRTFARDAVWPEPPHPPGSPHPGHRGRRQESLPVAHPARARHAVGRGRLPAAGPGDGGPDGAGRPL